ncbi:MAG: hypothetical protein R5N74_06115, partial [Cutibacterium granulosum]|nr:hypothetical protein [Cutibacterium granulosum]
MTTIDTANACCAANAGEAAPVTDAAPRTIAEACDVVTTPHLTLPADGVFGGYGGSVLPAALERPMAEVAQAYDEARNDPEFYAEYLRLLREF